MVTICNYPFDEYLKGRNECKQIWQFGLRQGNMAMQH